MRVAGGRREGREGCQSCLCAVKGSAAEKLLSATVSERCTCAKGGVWWERMCGKGVPNVQRGAYICEIYELSSLT